MKTGIIKMIQPTERGGYQSKQGWIYTFNMTIDVAGEGQTTGEIGSRSEIYPLSVGETIHFERQNTEYGVRFKKVNPQYAQSGHSTQGQAAGGANAPQRNYDAENRGKCRTQFIKAAIIAGHISCRDFAECDMLVQYAMTGIAPPTRTQQNLDDDLPF